MVLLKWVKANIRTGRARWEVQKIALMLYHHLMISKIWEGAHSHVMINDIHLICFTALTHNDCTCVFYQKSISERTNQQTFLDHSQLRSEWWVFAWFWVGLPGDPWPSLLEKLPILPCVGCWWGPCRCSFAQPTTKGALLRRPTYTHTRYQDDGLSHTQEPSWLIFSVCSSCAKKGVNGRL